MYFSRIRVANPGMRRSALGLYAEHELIWSLFPDEPEANRDFLYRRTDAERAPQFYVVSHREPRGADGWSIETKTFDPAISTNQRFNFSLRVNPVVRKRTAEGKQKREDVVMDTRHKRKAADLEFPGHSAILEEAGREWLLKRAEDHGFALNTAAFLIDSYFKMDDKHRTKGNRLHFGVIDYSGTLTVTNPETFRQTLFAGIGPAKAFGCGLLLIRPAV